MKSILRWTLITLITISCSSKKEVVRFYGECCTQIVLNPNKTFEYRVVLGVGGEIIRKGTWREHAGDTILLNTIDQPKNKKTTYKGTINSKLKNKVRISIRDFQNYLGGTLIEVNDGELSKFADDKGIAEFETNHIKNVSYFYVGTGEKITITNPEFNEIDILVKDLDFEIVPKYFTDQPIVVTNRKVVFYPNDSEKKFERKRKNIRHKKWN